MSLTSGIPTMPRGGSPPPLAVAVEIVAGGGSGGTSSTDEDVFTPGGTAGTPLMGVVNPTDTPANGELAVAALDSSRRLQIAGTFSASPQTSSASTNPAQTVVGTTAVQLLASNAGRKGFLIQNTGTTRIKLSLGGTNPTQTAYHVCLAAGGSADDGSSMIYTGPPGLIWTGAVQAISSASGGTVVVTELT